jgi:hypothetical protein
MVANGPRNGSNSSPTSGAEKRRGAPTTTHRGEGRREAARTPGRRRVRRVCSAAVAVLDEAPQFAFERQLPAAFVAQRRERRGRVARRAQREVGDQLGFDDQPTSRNAVAQHDAQPRVRQHVATVPRTVEHLQPATAQQIGFRGDDGARRRVGARRRRGTRHVAKGQQQAPLQAAQFDVGRVDARGRRAIGAPWPAAALQQAGDRVRATRARHIVAAIAGSLRSRRRTAAASSSAMPARNQRTTKAAAVGSKGPQADGSQQMTEGVAFGRAQQFNLCAPIRPVRARAHRGSARTRRRPRRSGGRRAAPTRS